MRQEYELLLLTAGTPQQPQDPARLQTLANLLVAWIQTPDWEASQTYLADHAAELLTADAAAALELLLAANPGHATITEHLALLRQCMAVGIEDAYRARRDAAADPTAAGVAALLQMDSAEALEQTLDAHPALLELPALALLAGLLDQAHRAGETPSAVRILVLLLVVMEMRQRSEDRAFDLEEHRQFIALHEALLPVAGELGEAELLGGLRRSAGWAYNTLGNYYADRDAAHDQAIDAYTRGLAVAPENAVLVRNRAGSYIACGELDTAAVEIARAAAMEPDAPRLAYLRCELYTAQGDGAALGREAAQTVARTPEDAMGHFYTAVAHVFCGEEQAAAQAMAASSRLASTEQRTEGLLTLTKLAQRFPAHAVNWAMLGKILGENAE